MSMHLLEKLEQNRNLTLEEWQALIQKQSEYQKEFQKQAESCRNKYVIVRSALQAIEELRKYLS